MAAIAGGLSQVGASAIELARALAERMRHRSPDGIRCWDGGTVALAHGALHAGQILPAAQPLRLADGTAMVVDGRIDDRGSLRAALGLHGREAHASDAALFGAAWLRWRQELWRHVVGDYAIAVWEPALARLTLLRDRVGVRPLYWTRQAGWFAFASEPQALLAVPGAVHAVDPDVFAALHAPRFEVEDPAQTLYAGIRRLLPGEMLEVGADGTPRCTRVWRFAQLPPQRTDDADACLEDFRAVFDQAVACRVQEARKPALMLSGGIDSAAIHASALAQGLELRRVSVLAKQWNAADELSNIEAMLAQAAQAMRLPLQDIAALDLQRLVDEILVRAHPVLSTLALPMLVGQAAVADGCRVLLDGIDGDLALHAPGHYVGHLAREGRWRLALRESRLAAQRHTYLKHLPAWRIFVQSLGALLEPAASARLRERIADARHGRHAFEGVLHPDLVASRHLRERSLHSRLAGREALAHGDWRAHRLALWDRPGFMRGMEGYDLAAARWGLEPRHPWADMRVLESIARMPLRALVRDGWTKYVARRAYAPELGAVAWHSGKAHLGPQVTALLLQAGRPQALAALVSPHDATRGLLRQGVLESARREWETGHTRIGSIDTLIAIASFKAWLNISSIK